MKPFIEQNKKELGFTLVEVLASVVILAVVMTGVINLLIFTNKSAVANNDRLVAINLAKATLERIKVQPTAYFDPTAVTPTEKDFTEGNCTPTNCQGLYRLIINDKTYEVTVSVSQKNNPSQNEKELGLINVVVTVKLPDKNAKSEVEGYVHDVY